MKALIRGSAAVFLAIIFATPAEGRAGMDYGPVVLEITGPVLSAFEKGLRAEIALREELKKQMAARATRAQYDKCVMALMTDPNSQKFNEALTTMPSQAKPEELQHRMMRFGAALQARLAQKCGPDPGYGNNVVSREQLEAIERKAVSVAGPIP